MKSTNDDIEEPVKKSWALLVVSLLVLAFTIGIGIFLLVEALQKPKTPEDVLDMKRMLISGVAVILFSVAIVFFLLSLYRPSKKGKKRVKATGKKPVRKKTTQKRTR
jgi:uncharacterized BrkB/YihY/UPF0761 family membrane protein